MCINRDVLSKNVNYMSIFFIYLHYTITITMNNMKKTSISKTLLSAVAISLLGMSAVSCVDSDYDLNEDIDMTVGVGTDGLKFKLGSTQKILMKNVLEVDNDFKTDASNMYYLIKNGNTQSDFHIGSVSSSIEDVRYTTDAPVIDFDMIKDMIEDLPMESVHVPQGFKIATPSPVKASGSFTYDVKDIDDDILSIERLNFHEGAKAKITLEIQNSGMMFNFLDMTDMVISLPEYLDLKGFSNGEIDGNKLIVNDIKGIYNDVVSLGEIYIRGVDLSSTSITDQGTMHLQADVAFQSSFSFIAGSAFDVDNGDVVNVSVVLSVEDNDGTPGSVSVKSAEGKFDPVIEPKVDDIAVSSSLPDFLKDDEVTISVSNPTFKFHSDMSGIPVQLAFNMRTASKKNGAETAEVWFPASDGKAVLYNNKENTLYFHQSEAGPYDPAGVAEGSDKYKVDNISDLLYKLPDFISVDLSNGKVKVDNSEVTKVELNRSYTFSADYDVYIPFQFDKGLKIVYTDSIENMRDDLQDYEADSAAVSAVVENTVPLDLDLELIPVDMNGAVLPCIHVDKVKINAAGGSAPENTEIYINIRLDNRSDLKKLDKLRFRISANSIDNGLLTSDQYIQLKDIRLILKGQVVCDLN